MSVNWWMGNRMWHIMEFSVQSLSRVQLFATPWTAACQASLSITNSQSSLKLTPIESVMPFSHLILCRPLHLLPPIPPSIRVFSNESTLHMRWPKYWSFSFRISPSNEHPGLISFRMDWLDLLAVQETLKSLLQHHSSKASILRRSAGLHKGIVACVHHYSITESSFTPKNPLCSAHSSFHSPQSFTSSGSFPMSQFFTAGGENIGASTSASILPMNIQG